MASIQKRKSHGQTYWYIVESKRVNGKPRPVTLAYLGKPEDLLSRLKQGLDYKLKSYSHGDAVALIETARELDIIETINKHVPVKQYRDNITIGGTILLAAIGRACNPTSKMGWYDWCKQTSLEYCLKKKLCKLDSQHFWDQMNALPADKIPLIEEDLVKKMVSNYNIKLNTIYFDTSNFFTFIDSKNTRCKIPQRGHNKQKRKDLRQFGLGFMVSKSGQFPLFHQTYEGNKNDVTHFYEVLSKLKERIKRVSDDATEVTLVFDKGNNSKKNFKLIDDDETLHYIASLVISHFKSIVDEAQKVGFTEVMCEDEKTLAYRVDKKVWGKDRTCVVFLSDILKDGQLRGLEQQLTKKYKELDKLQMKICNKTKKYTELELTKAVKKIITGQYLKDVLQFKIIKDSDSYTFSYFIDIKKFCYLRDVVFGVQILATNRSDWSTPDIILAYKSKTKIEYAFRNLKNPYHLAIRPQFHWTDQKIHVHSFISVIAYMLATCAYSKAKQAGYERNMDNFLDDLKTVRLTSIINQNKRKLNVVHKLEEIDPFLIPILKKLNISSQNFFPEINFSVYN